MLKGLSFGRFSHGNITSMYKFYFNWNMAESSESNGSTHEFQVEWFDSHELKNHWYQYSPNIYPTDLKRVIEAGAADDTISFGVHTQKFEILVLRM